MSSPRALDQFDGSEIAVIGLAGRFPGAKTIDQYWQNICHGVESIRFFSDDELRAAGVSPALLDKPNYVKARPVLDDIDMFDAGFFGFNPTEAMVLDPQHRLFLECVWNVLERAGYDPDSYPGAISVFAGTSMSSYLLNNLYANPEAMTNAGLFLSFLSNSPDSLTTRIAYKLNLKGACFTLQTFCSTSLVAVHVACQSLLNLECDIAVAGGVSILVPQISGYWFEEGGIRAPDGHCRPFDAKAQGTLFGNGCGAVALKRLEDALKDGDAIEAVIKGSATNNDGSLKVSYSAPSVAGQAAVIVEALANADVSPETVTYVETHGTGTSLGDPAEIAALTQAFGSGTDKKGYCGIGSVKSNIGHLDAAAGIASLIKAILALKHRKLPPSLHFETPNPEIDFPNSPFYVNVKLAEWKSPGTPLRAGVSSFGIGGTNAHVVLQEAPRLDASSPSRSHQLLLVSAKTEAALNQATQNLGQYLENHGEVTLADVAFTLQAGRKAFNHRCILVCHNTEEARAAFTGKDPKRLMTQYQDKRNSPIAFMFPGQDGQPAGTGAGLYRAESVFREHADASADLFRSYLGYDLREALFPAAEGLAAGARPAEQTQIAQPALFVIEYALGKLWQSWGVRPAAMIGHGVGEYVAACLAGVFSLEDAAALVVMTSPVSRSAMLEPVLEAFRERIKLVRLNRPSVPLISSLTGTWMTPDQATNADYWTRQLSKTAHVSEGFQELLGDPNRILLEVGPSQTLAWLVKQQPNKSGDRVVISSLAPAPGASSEVASMLTAAGRLWLAGIEIDWVGFYSHERRYRLPLPTYPFDYQRYWVEPQIHPAAASLAQRALTKKADPTDWFWLPSWKRCPLPPPGNELAQPSSKTSWLIFLDDCGLGTQLAAHLRSQFHTVTTATVGTEFARLSEDGYSINPRVAENYQSLLSRLRASGKTPNHIVHLWSVTGAKQVEAGEFLERCSTLGFQSLLFLAQAIGEQLPRDPILMKVLSTHLHEVVGGEVLYADKATILGPCRVIPQEFSNVSCCSIDIVLPTGERSPHQDFVAQLIPELTTKTTDMVVAYRGGHRWVQTFEPIRLEHTAQLPARLRRHGVYLITGGLGGIGLALAEHLAQQVQAKLILIGRTSLPPRSEWSNWLATNRNKDDVSRRIQKIQALEQLGAEVLVLSANVANAQEMEAVLGEARARFGSLHGVIHAAGLPGGGIIQLRTMEMATKVLMPKIMGTLVLGRLLHDVTLDFFALCSSTTSLLGGVGQVDYCGANAFLDAYAQENRSRNVIALNWCAWSEVGMAVDTEVPEDLKAERALSLRLGLLSAEGQEAFNRALNSAFPQVLVSTQDFLAVRETYSNLQPRAASETSARGTSGKQVHPRPNLSTPYQPAENPEEQAIVEIWQNLLGIQKVGRLDSFFELGGHSLLATQVLSRLRETFRVDLPLRTLFEVTTVAELARRVQTIQWLAASQTAPTAHEEREEIEL